MRPRWSQEFLAEELTRRGYPATRGQIARLEHTVPGAHDSELTAAVAQALQIPLQAVQRAREDDFERVWHRASLNPR